jgi:NodT family efflux transporter outer membrane factor (OMF) lipoprotein
VINNFTFPLDVSYTVDLWHRVRNTVAANEYSAQASAADIATSKLSIQAEVAQDYFQVRALDAQRKIYEDTVANYRQQLNLVETLYRAGIDSEEEVAQARTQLDTATAQLTDLGVSRANYEHAIAVLTGQPPSTFSLPPAPFVPKPPEVPVAVPSVLLERRPDIASSERRVAAANAQIGVARAAYYPDLTLSAAAGFQTSHFTQWFNWPSRFWSLGPTLSQTLFDAGARRGATEQAEANYDAAVAAYRGSVLSAFQAVEDNLSTLRILSTEIVQEHTAVNSANRYLELSLSRFRAGVDSYLNVITAQNTLLTNRQTEVQIELRQMTASVSLVMALGGGWDNTQLPAAKQLLAKPAKWSPPSAAAPSGAQGTPNPPPLNPNLPVPGAPQADPSDPKPTPPPPSPTAGPSTPTT